MASYAYFRKDEPLPFPVDKVREAIEIVWADTLGNAMDAVDRAGMHMETESDRQLLEQL